MNNTLKYSLIASAILVGVITVNPFHPVPTGSRGVVTQFGRIVGVEPEGLAILPPWQSLNNFSIRSEQADVENADGSTSDTQQVKVSLTVRYSIAPDKVSEVYEKYSHDGDLSSYIQTATQEVFKAVTARYTAPELISKRQQVSTDINSALKEKIAVYGAQIINIDMRNFTFDPTYMAAINEKVTQEQKKLAADNKYLTVKSEQNQIIVIAEAAASAVKAQADGDAYAKITMAEANAKALSIQNEALSKSTQVLELKRIEVDLEKARRWNGALPTSMYAGAPMPFLKVDKD